MISLGVLVDDAIIDIENIVRRIRQHDGRQHQARPRRIILDASIEVRGPIVHATTIILVSTLPDLPARPGSPARSSARWRSPTAWPSWLRCWSH